MLKADTRHGPANPAPSEDSGEWFKERKVAADGPVSVQCLLPARHLCVHRRAGKGGPATGLWGKAGWTVDPEELKERSKALAGYASGLLPTDMPDPTTGLRMTTPDVLSAAAWWQMPPQAFSGYQTRPIRTGDWVTLHHGHPLAAGGIAVQAWAGRVPSSPGETDSGKCSRMTLLNGASVSGQLLPGNTGMPRRLLARQSDMPGTGAFRDLTVATVGVLPPQRSAAVGGRLVSGAMPPAGQRTQADHRGVRAGALVTLHPDHPLSAEQGGIARVTSVQGVLVELESLADRVLVDSGVLFSGGPQQAHRMLTKAVRRVLGPPDSVRLTAAMRAKGVTSEMLAGFLEKQAAASESALPGGHVR